MPSPRAALPSDDAAVLDLPSGAVSVSPKVFDTFGRIVAEHFGRCAPQAALEVGAARQTLLALRSFDDCRRVALNMKGDLRSQDVELPPCDAFWSAAQMI